MQEVDGRNVPEPDASMQDVPVEEFSRLTMAVDEESFKNLVSRGEEYDRISNENSRLEAGLAKIMNIMNDLYAGPQAHLTETGFTHPLTPQLIGRSNEIPPKWLGFYFDMHEPPNKTAYLSGISLGLNAINLKPNVKIQVCDYTGVDQPVTPVKTILGVLGDDGYIDFGQSNCVRMGKWQKNHKIILEFELKPNLDEYFWVHYKCGLENHGAHYSSFLSSVDHLRFFDRTSFAESTIIAGLSFVVM